MSRRSSAGDSSFSRVAAITAALTVFVALMLLLWAGNTYVVAQTVTRVRTETDALLHPYGIVLSQVINDDSAAVDAFAAFAAAEVAIGRGMADAEPFASGLLAERSGLAALEVKRGDTVLFAGPVGGVSDYLEGSFGTEHDSEIAADSRRASDSGKTTISGPFVSPEDGAAAMVVFSPIVVDGEHWGMASGLVELQPLLEVAGLDTQIPGLETAVVDPNGNTVSGDAQTTNREPVLHEVPVVDGVWILAAIPSGGWDSVRPATAGLLLALGTVLALACAIVTFLAVSSRARLEHRLAERTAEFAEVNDRLAHEVGALRDATVTLAASEERFRLLFEQSPTALGIMAHGHIVLANQALSDLLGLASPQDAIGMAGIDLVEPEHRDEVLARFTEPVTPGEARESYRTVLCSDGGEQIPVENHMIVFVADDTEYTLVSVMDLRPQLAEESALQASAATYRALFDHSSTPMFEEDFSAAKEYVDGLGVDPDELDEFLREHPEHVSKGAAGMRIVRVNPAGVQVLRATAEADVLGVLGSFVNARTVDLFRSELVAIGRGKSSFHAQAYLPTVDGEVLWFDISWQVPRVGDLTYDKVYVSMIDLSDERRLRAQLEEYRDGLEQLVDERTRELRSTNEQLVEATMAKDDFLAAMSHELRTPLNSIIGFSGVMLQGLAGALNDEQQRQLNMVQRAGKHLLKLINEMLDLSKITARRTEIRVSAFDVTAVCRAARDEMVPLAREKGLTVECSPALDDPIMHGDPDRIRQILLNLVANAVKFTRTGTISLEVYEDGGDVCFGVEDTGPGIPVQEREAVFEPFHQFCHGDTAKAEGTGLGLTISRNLAELMGGTLVLAEKKGAGTRFVLRIPREASGSSEIERLD